VSDACVRGWGHVVTGCIGIGAGGEDGERVDEKGQKE
jgi:hypothetical protein